jgi:hypothetical protein
MQVHWRLMSVIVSAAAAAATRQTRSLLLDSRVLSCVAEHLGCPSRLRCQTGATANRCAVPHVEAAGERGTVLEYAAGLGCSRAESEQTGREPCWDRLSGPRRRQSTRAHFEVPYCVLPNLPMSCGICDDGSPSVTCMTSGTTDITTPAFCSVCKVSGRSILGKLSSPFTRLVRSTNGDATARSLSV